MITKLRHDTHREVRIRVVSLLEDGDLVAMMGDPDYYVRLVICRKVDRNLLLRWCMMKRRRCGVSLPRGYRRSG